MLNLMEDHSIVDEGEGMSSDEATGRGRARDLDQYYTVEAVARSCMETIFETVPVDDIDMWIEPSAGTGVFLRMLPEPRRGFDIDSLNAADDVEEMDFLKWKPDREHGAIAIVGNPPFGRNCSKAVRFFNHAARFADWICMILPRTFEKDAVRNKLAMNFVQVGETRVLPANSFTHEGEPYDVPCCFQMWKRVAAVDSRSPARSSMRHSDFEFVSNPEDADFAFQRVGVRAGLASKEGLARSWKSNHFIKAAPGVDVDELMAQINSIDWTSISNRTAGNPSISKGEMVAAIAKLRPDSGPADLFSRM